MFQADIDLLQDARVDYIANADILATLSGAELGRQLAKKPFTQKKRTPAKFRVNFAGAHFSCNSIGFARR
jgi:hypothetical protein